MLRAMRTALSLALLLSLSVGCGDDDGTPDADGGADPDGDVADMETEPDMGPEPIVAAECDNSQDIRCFLPWPSSVFLAEDATTETGFRVDVPDEYMPTNRYGDPLSRFSPWENFDGFSPAGSLMTGFAGMVDDTTLADELHIPDTLSPASQTLIIDADTGELVAHFAEIDEWSSRDRDTTTLYMRPATRLQEDHRYVAAIRTGLLLLDGTEIEPSAHFAALRASETGDPLVEARQPAMDSIFATLEMAGVGRDELLVAWDFHTASGDSIRGDLLAMWADAKVRWDDAADDIGTCTVESVEMDVNDTLWKRIRGTYTVPLYMENADAGALVNRDASGRPAYNGTAEAPFEIAIPPSVRDRVMAGNGPGRGLMHGHGLLGAANQTSSGGMRAVMQRSEMVGFGTDYWGLSESDLDNLLLEVVPDFGQFDELGERLMQGTINSLVLMKTFAAGGPCSELAEMQIDVDGTMEPTMDPDELYYYGISQGGIMGGTLAALSDTIDRYVLQVGGTTYSTMVRRSKDFEGYELILSSWFTEKLDRDFLVASTQSVWSQAEPAPYLAHIFGEPLPGVDTSDRHILYQVSRYDTEVSNITSDMAARAMGLGVFDSSVYHPFGVDVITEDSVDDAMIIFHLSEVEPLALGTVDPDGDNNAHGDLRYQDEVLEQIELFCHPDGAVVDTCPDNSCLLANDRL
mgnify:CR=1 FL=1|tara:strand:+ start:713 stop:2782 length:2070 start_codon:yes stop_codon:yes gene_type:complete